MSAIFLLVLVATSASANLFYHDRFLSGEEQSRDEFTRKVGRGESWETCDCQTISPVPDNIRTEMPLDDFYQKYTHAYGIPVIASGQPSDEALTRACYVVRFMLADRKDVRDAMFDSYGRVGVIGLHEQTTDIPEHSHLPDFYNERARGLGGVPSMPITTDGEENILCKSRKEDRWYEEDVLVHEFAHAIHLIAMERVDRNKENDNKFKNRLKKAWQEAKAALLWQHTYLITKATEYFAEGVQVFFNVQTAYRGFQDNVHNNISNRADLYDYDIKLYNLIEEVFPCKHEIVDRCVADQELAATQELQMNCTYSGR